MTFLQLDTLLLVLAFYMLGGTRGALLKTSCEGESLLGCLNEADAILQNVQLTFPADESSLSSVCKMWIDMTECIHGYTTKCLTAKETLEFHSYFEVPMTSMIVMCTNGNVTAKYFRQANCIKTISMEESFCGKEYKMLVSEITDATTMGVKNICCALDNFKDCVSKVKMESVCGGERSVEGDVVNTTLVALEKSLLTFVMHSCDKERSAGCGSVVRTGSSERKDGEIQDLQVEDGEKNGVPQNEALNIPPAYVETLGSLGEHKPLLIPLDHELQWGKVNVTNMGEIGKKRTGLTSVGKGPMQRIPSPFGYSRDFVTPMKQYNNSELGSDREGGGRLSGESKPVPTVNTTSAPQVTLPTSTTITTKGFEIGPDYSESASPPLNSSGDIERRNGSRLNAGRSLDSYLIGSEAGASNMSNGTQGSPAVSQGGRADLRPQDRGTVGEVPRRFGVPFTESTLATKTEGRTSTLDMLEAVSSTTGSGSEMRQKKNDLTTFRSSSSTMNPLMERNQLLGLPWLITTTYVPLIRKKGKGREQISKQLDLNATESRIADGLKGNGGSSTSRVPLRVFMVWLSTFFV